MSDIKNQLTSGIFYTAITKYTGIVISIAITGVLSHLLTPEEFGTIVPVSVLVAFFTILGDVGIGPAIIQTNTLAREEVESIFSFTLLTAFLFSVLFFFGSWVIASVYDSTVLIPICQLLSLSLFFSSTNVVPNALLFKEKKFRYLAIRSLVAQSAAGLIAIISAYMGAGLYALVIQSILSSACIFGFSYMANPLKLRLVQIRPLKKIWSFSSFQFLFNILNYFSVNLDKLLLKNYMGTTALGYYDKSYKLMQMPLQNIPFIITPVMHPIFSEMQNDMEKMSFYYSKIVRFLAFIGFPLSVLLFFTGQELILFIFGPQWVPSIPVFKILALSVGFQIILATSGSILQASGLTRLLFLCGILSTATIVTAILTGLFGYHTLEAISSFLVCAFIINFFLCFAIIYCRVFRSGFILFLRQLISPLILSVLLAGMLHLVSRTIISSDILTSLFIKSCVAVCVSGLYIQMTGEYNLFKKIREYAGKLKKR